MSNLVEVKIPTNANPFTVTVNGKKYSYPAGATVQVPPEVAEVIEQIGRGPNLPPSSGGGGSGGGTGGGGDLLNANGVIKQQHLPENFPYKAKAMVSGDTLTWDGNTDGLVSMDAFAEMVGTFYKISDAVPTLEDCISGATYTIAYDGKQENRSVGYDEIAEMSGLVGCLCIGDFIAMVAPENNFQIELEGVTAIFPEAGLYTNAGGDISLTSLTIPGYTGFVAESETITKIGKEYLPEGYPYAEHRVFLPETTPVFNEDSGGFVIMSGVDASMFTNGQTYTVNWNGTNYETRAQLSSDNVMNAIILGDMWGAQGAPTTGEPFMIMILDTDAQAAMGVASVIVPIDGSASVTLSIIGETLTPVDAKFLPNATVFVDVYGTIGGTYANSDSEKPENISKQSHTNAEILALAKLGKNVIIRNYDSETGTAFKCYNLSEVDFNFARFTKVYFSSSDGIGSTIEVLINGKMSMQETKFA